MFDLTRSFCHTFRHLRRGPRVTETKPNAPKRPFHIADDADIKSGEVSDVYFARTLRRQGLRRDF